MTKKMLSFLLAVVVLPMTHLYGQGLDEYTSRKDNFLQGQVDIFLIPSSNSYILQDLLYAPSIDTRFVFISEGKYTKKGEEIIFTDSRIGYSIVVKYVEYPEKLEYLSGFRFLLGKTLTWNGANENTIKLMIKTYNEKWATWQYPHEKIETLKSTPARKKHRSGIYQNDYAFVRFKSNGEYELYYTENLISNGTWKQENSCIILEDKGLKCNFYMGLDSEGELHSLLLPGFYAPEEQWLPFKKIDKFPEGTGDVPYEYETIEVIDPESEFGSCISD